MWISVILHGTSLSLPFHLECVFVRSLVHALCLLISQEPRDSSLLPIFARSRSFFVLALSSREWCGSIQKRNILHELQMQNLQNKEQTRHLRKAQTMGIRGAVHFCSLQVPTVEGKLYFNIYYSQISLHWKFEMEWLRLTFIQSRANA